MLISCWVFSPPSSFSCGEKELRWEAWTWTWLITRSCLQVDRDNRVKAVRKSDPSLPSADTVCSQKSPIRWWVCSFLSPTVRWLLLLNYINVWPAMKKWTLLVTSLLFCLYLCHLKMSGPRYKFNLAQSGRSTNVSQQSWHTHTQTHTDTDTSMLWYL